MKTTGFNWLKKHIAKLESTSSQHKVEINKIKEIQSKIYNEVQTWAPLKLILLNYSLTICTTIIQNIIQTRPFIFNKMYYI